MPLAVVVTGSVAYDYIMSFPGHFKDHILMDKINTVSLSFLVDSMRRERGGCAANIAYSLALLGERPRVMGTVGQDFSDYRAWLEAHNVDTSTIATIDDDFTASFFCSTDLDNCQIANFYTGAMAKACQLSFEDQESTAIDLVVISPNDASAMVKYARECRALGIPYMYDPSQQIVRLNADELREGIAGAKILIVNEYEFEMIKKKTGLSEAEIHAAVQTVIVTRGENGSVITSCGHSFEIPAVKPKVLAEPTGVGDAYRAGIIKGILHGYPWPIAGRLGSLAAVYVLEKHGTQNHCYTLEEFVGRFREEFGRDSASEPILNHILCLSKENDA
jgi:adenosine kinase